MRTKLVAYFLLIASLSVSAQSKFGKDQVLSDLDFLRESVEDVHYNVFAYVTEDQLDSAYQQVRSSVKKDSLNLLEVTTLYQQFISAIRNGHTEIPFPGQSYGEYAYAGGTLLPLDVAFEDGKVLIRKNWSENEDIKVGSELLSVNGVPMAEILKKIYPQISAERRYFKHVKIELYSFPRLYWQVYGEEAKFEVEIQTDEKVEMYNLEAVNLIEAYEMKREEVLNARKELRFIQDAAYLNPGNFSGDESRYQNFIDSAFYQIRDHSTEILIIDLRNNGGGNDLFSDYLVSYLADKPFTWNSSFTIKSSQFLKQHVREYNDTTNTYFREILDHDDGEIYAPEPAFYHPQPLDKRFQGKVYVLINRQSHSQSAVTAAQIQDYHFGTLVGEETGDYATLYASQFSYTLPRTGVPVNVSKGLIVRVNGSMEEEGVIPDIFIRDHLVDDKDEVLEQLLMIID